MQAIQVPENVTLVDPVTEEALKGVEPVTFKQFVIATLMADQRWGRDLDSIESALKIKKAVRAFGKPGDKLLLEDEDAKRLRECAQTPSQGYGTWGATIVDQLAPFLIAIKNAAKDESK